MFGDGSCEFVHSVNHTLSFKVLVIFVFSHFGFEGRTSVLMVIAYMLLLKLV